MLYERAAKKKNEIVIIIILTNLTLAVQRLDKNYFSEFILFTAMIHITSPILANTYVIHSYLHQKQFDKRFCFV